MGSKHTKSYKFQISRNTGANSILPTIVDFRDRTLSETLSCRYPSQYFDCWGVAVASSSDHGLVATAWMTWIVSSAICSRWLDAVNVFFWCGRLFYVAILSFLLITHKNSTVSGISSVIFFLSYRPALFPSFIPSGIVGYCSWLVLHIISLFYSSCFFPCSSFARYYGSSPVNVWQGKIEKPPIERWWWGIWPVRYTSPDRRSRRCQPAKWFAK